MQTGTYTPTQIRNHAYYIEHKEHLLEWDKEYRKTHKERINGRIRRYRLMKQKDESEKHKEWMNHIFPVYLPEMSDEVTLPKYGETDAFFHSYTLLETGVVRFYDGKLEFQAWFELLTDGEKEEFSRQKENFLKEIAALKRLLQLESWESASEKLDYIIKTYEKIWKLVGLKLTDRLQ